MIKPTSHLTDDFLNDLFHPVNVRPSDRFSFYYVAGFMFGVLDTEDGMHVEVVRHYETGIDFSSKVPFDKRSMDKPSRNALIAQLCDGGIPQVAVARFFEMSQSSISNITRKLSKLEQE